MSRSEALEIESESGSEDFNYRKALSSSNSSEDEKGDDEHF